MAWITSRVQYVALGTTKDIFWMRGKICCSVYVSNFTPKKSVHNGFSGFDLHISNQYKNFRLMSEKKYVPTAKEKQIMGLLFKELKVNHKFIFNEICKHPKRKFLTFSQVAESLKFLQVIGFSKEAIGDIPAICFYPTNKIKMGLEEVTRNSVELYKFGFENGCVENETPAFIFGSKSKNKTLQLCLYYIELPFSFNGGGLFDIDDTSTCNRETEL